MENSKEKRLREKKSNNLGITLIALVITIIVLLILAGVSLSAVFSQQGIFSRAENAVNKHSKSKARETLDLVLSESQMKKYDEGLSDTELDKMIESVGQLLPKDDPDSNNQLVIVEGYIFEIDRSVPKVLEEKGPADGIIITATISGNNGWVKPGESVAVKGSIKTYSGGTITSTSATKKDGTAIADFQITGENYIINNITEDTEITITAEDSKGKMNSKTVNVLIKRDTIPPTVETVTAEAEGLTIRISATGIDNESGLKNFNYTITPQFTEEAKGTFKEGETIEILTTKQRKYTITITGTDNAENTTELVNAKKINVITEEQLTIEEAKRVIKRDGLLEHMGSKITDYNPEAGGNWRVFYYDTDGYFGKAGALYIKRDIEKDGVTLRSYENHTSSDNRQIMKLMNPMWAKSKTWGTRENKRDNGISWLYDPKVWEKYKVNELADFAMGAPGIEMFIRAYNECNLKKSPLECSFKDDKEDAGYLVNGTIWQINSLSLFEYGTLVNIFEGLQLYHVWVASPAYDSDHILFDAGASQYISASSYTNSESLCPIVRCK